MPYLIDVIANLKAPNAILFYVSSALTAATFLAIGFIKGKVSKQSPWQSNARCNCSWFGLLCW
ncbi:hypothetical protein KOY49_04335 [Candidatus Minimicrobia vallesae]|uniref:Uncharacterized protein n=1 Tax=Candidatus Minimicrobia vallesae TaxID=2841264 RepID=A0A8F1MAL5_9BACT|nr:hypothetical protein KOY49_04335 [Candidatus Minimicrobia vallesae]